MKQLKTTLAPLSTPAFAGFVLVLTSFVSVNLERMRKYTLLSQGTIHGQYGQKVNLGQVGQASFCETRNTCAHVNVSGKQETPREFTMFFPLSLKVSWRNVGIGCKKKSFSIHSRQIPGAPNDNFLSDPLKHFRRSGVALKLYRFILGSAVIFLSVRSL